MQKINKFLAKIEEFKKEHKLDLSSDEDLSIAIMNLISLEEHLFFTGAKTGKDEYYNLLSKVREMRKDLLKKIVKESEGEVWCCSKHLLAASMRLIEIGTKFYNQGKKKQAQDLFSKAYDLYSLFWGINLELVKVEKTKKADKQNLNDFKENKDDLAKRLNNLVEELIDCCKA